jgi:hypothetical protein
MKAGILNHMKKHEDALEAAQLAIKHSNAVQGYLHGAAALRQLKRDQELVALLESGQDAHPGNESISGQLKEVKKHAKLSLASSALPVES